MRPAGSPYAVFQRALRNGNLWAAEAEARDMRHVSLEDALKLVHLYAEKEAAKVWFGGDEMAEPLPRSAVTVPMGAAHVTSGSTTSPRDHRTRIVTGK